MATFYGEVLPVISRAVDEDEEDDDKSTSVTCDPFIHWSGRTRNNLLHLPNNKHTCNILIIAIGPAAVGFTDIYIKYSDFYLVGGIFTGLRDGDQQTLSQDSPTDKTCYIYRGKEDASTFICLCNMDVGVEQCHVWVNQLFKDFDTEDAYVVVLNTLHSSKFVSEVPVSDLHLPVLRGLKTSMFAGTILCPVLEQPNLVTGLAAQVMTYCQAYALRAVLYQCYTKSRQLVDVATVKAFMPVLESIPVRDIIKPNPDAERLAKGVVTQHDVQDTLYL